MPKFAIIVIQLVPEAKEEKNKIIRNEIRDELKNHPALIPWTHKIKNVAVIGCGN